MIKSQSHGLLAFAFIFVGFGDLIGKADCDRRAGLVVAQTQAQRPVTDPFAINGQGPWERAQIRAQPGAQTFGEFFDVDLGQDL